MTVGDLLEVAPEIVEIEITIRDNGKYIYRYVIGEYVEIHQGYPEHNHDLEIGERIETKTRDYIYPFPATFWAIKPHKASKDIKALEIYDIKFTSNMISWKYKNYKHSWRSKAYITCYPKGWTKPQETKTDQQIAGQMDITEFLQ